MHHPRKQVHVFPLTPKHARGHSRWCKDKFSHKYDATVGVDHAVKMMRLGMADVSVPSASRPSMLVPEAATRSLPGKLNPGSSFPSESCGCCVSLPEGLTARNNGDSPALQVRVNIWDLGGAPEFFEIRNEFYKVPLATKGCEICHSSTLLLMEAACVHASNAWEMVRPRRMRKPQCLSTMCVIATALKPSIGGGTKRCRYAIATAFCGRESLAAFSPDPPCESRLATETCRQS